MGDVRFTSRIKEVLEKLEIDLDKTVLNLATDVHSTASRLAPRDTGNLVKSGRISRVDEAHYTVTFGGDAGGFNVPYARRRHFENKKNPGTIGYLEIPGRNAARNIKKYLVK